MGFDGSFVSGSRTHDSAQPKRVLFLSTDMGMGGGAEEQVIHLAYGMKRRGWGAMIVSLLPPSPMPTDFAMQGIPLAHLGMRAGVPDPRSLYRLVRILRDFRPDVVHSHMVHANLLGRMVRLVRRFPVLICTLHNLTMAGVKRDWSPVFETAHRLTDWLCDRSTAICASAAEHAVRHKAVPGKKMLVVHNGIDTTQFSPDPASRERVRRELSIGGEFVWLAVGRLELQKAYPTLLRAFSMQQNRDSVLWICGQGSLREQLEAMADELGIGSRVKFLGLQSDIPAIMNAADAFVLSSDLEGLPLVLLQAAASGLPIVATDVGGNSEAVVAGVNGVLVPPGNPAALAEAMARMSSLPAAERWALGQAGRARTRESFETERIIDRWVNLYEELLAPGTRRAAGATVREAAIV